MLIKLVEYRAENCDVDGGSLHDGHSMQRGTETAIQNFPVTEENDKGLYWPVSECSGCMLTASQQSRIQFRER
jgi:hypothetical protein